MNFSNVKIHYIRPNLACVLQPLGAGIIRSFKAKYKKKFLEYVEKWNMENNSLKLTIKDAIEICAAAWDSVTVETIKNCWLKVGILPNVFEMANEETDRKATIEALNIDDSTDCIKLSYLISRVQSERPMTTIDYITSDEFLENYTITDEVIVNRIILESNLQEPNSNKSDESSSSIEEPLIDHGVGVSHLMKALVYTEQNNFASENEIKMLHKLVDKAKIYKLAEISSSLK